MGKTARNLLTILLGGAIVLAGVGVLGWATKGFKNWDFNFNSSTETTDPGTSTEDPTSQDPVPLPQNLIFTKNALTDSKAAATITVKAIITPSNATNKGVTWTSSNPDAVTVTQSETDQLTATLTCLSDFDEKVTITVASKENPNIKATCVVDYKQKLLSATGTIGSFTFSDFNEISETEAVNLTNITSVDSINTFTYKGSATLSKGTILISDQTSYVLTGSNFEFSSTITTAWNSFKNTPGGFDERDKLISDINTILSSVQQGGEYRFSMDFSKLVSGSGGISNLTESNQARLHNWLVNNISNSTDYIFQGTFAFGDLDSKTIKFKASGMDKTIEVESISVDKPSVEF